MTQVEEYDGVGVRNKIFLMKLTKVEGDDGVGVRNILFLMKEIKYFL